MLLKGYINCLRSWYVARCAQSPNLYPMSDAVRKFKAALPRPPRKGKGAALKAADDVQDEDDSPDKSDNRQWATGRKCAYLVSHMEGWKEAIELDLVSDFYDNVTVRWIAMWGWSLPAETDAPPDVEDPSPAAMEAILKITEESQATQEAQRRREYFWKLRGVRQTRSKVVDHPTDSLQRLARWFRHHGRKSLKHNKSDSVAKVISSFANMTAKPPKRRSCTQFYQRTYYDTRIRPSVDAEFERLCKEAAAANRDAPKHVAVSNAVAARLYAAESADFKAQMLKDLEDDYQQCLAKHKLLTGQNTVPSTAKEFHEYVARRLPADQLIDSSQGTRSLWPLAECVCGACVVSHGHERHDSARWANRRKRWRNRSTLVRVAPPSSN